MAVKIKTYKNGATLIHKTRKKRCTSVYAGFIFGRNRDRYPEPVAHFCEHMFFKETETRTEKQLRQDMIDTFSMNNGGTSKFFTHINFCRSNKALAPCFELASDMLLNTKFSKKSVNSEKGVIKQELVRKLNNPNALASNTLFKCLSSEIVNNFFVLGTNEEIDAITPKTLKKFRDENFIFPKFCDCN